MCYFTTKVKQLRLTAICQFAVVVLVASLLQTPQVSRFCRETHGLRDSLMSS